MKLPAMRFGDGLRKNNQVKFGGLNHNLGAGDGELWNMRNLTGQFYPLLATRPLRRLYRTLANPGGLFAWDGLCWVDGNGFYYKDVRRGTVTPGPKHFAALGAYIIILPDKAYFDTVSGTFGNLESKWSGGSLTFTNGALYGEAADANTIEASGVNWASYFKPGDAVEISGCTVHTENNKTPVIREISGNKMYFYENVFKLNGTDGDQPYTETGGLTIARTMPDLRFLCENENRLWGCDGTTIYASKLGDPFNWNVFDGVATDSYAVDTGSAGEFTGCVSYLGYPVFFKEDNIYKVYGTMPSNFEVMGSATLGLQSGSDGSLAIAGETLFYLSNAGIVAYSGGIPQPVGEALGPGRFRDAAAGSDGLNYYVSMRDENGTVRLYVYGSKTHLWHVEDETRATHFARWDGNLFYLNDKGEIWMTGSIADAPADSTLEGPFDWFAEFGDFTESSPDKKGMERLQVRLELEPGAWVRAWLQFDSDGVWREAGSVMSENIKRSYILPIIPRRSDHYRLKLEGFGACRVYSVTRESYLGSALRSKPGRQ